LPGGAVFGGREGFYIDGKLVAELVDGERIQLRLTKPLIRELRAALDADPRVQRRKASDWITVRFERAADATWIGELMARAAALYRPPAGVIPRPPPTGSDLEKRRRWH
jgi:Luciferase